MTKTRITPVLRLMNNRIPMIDGAVYYFRYRKDGVTRRCLVSKEKRMEALGVRQETRAEFMARWERAHGTIECLVRLRGYYYPEEVTAWTRKIQQLGELKGNWNWR
jgi:hypothetical protein